jgi:hypothetical protein
MSSTFTIYHHDLIEHRVCDPETLPGFDNDWSTFCTGGFELEIALCREPRPLLNGMPVPAL